MNGLIFDIDSLYAYFQRVNDMRKAKGKQYSLALLLVLMLLAKLAGKDTPSGIAEWVSHRLEQLFAMKVINKKKAPSHMTYRRVLQDTIDPEGFERLIGEYQQGHLEKGDAVAFSIDGKSLKRTIAHGKIRGTHLLSIYVPEGWFWQKWPWIARRMRLQPPPGSSNKSA